MDADTGAIAAVFVRDGDFGSLRRLRARLTNARDLFVRAAETGHLPMCQWLRAEFGLSADDCRAAMAVAVVAGRLRVARWLESEVGFPAFELDLVWNQLAADGHLGMLRWLRAEPVSARALRASMFRATETGRLDMLQWLCRLDEDGLDVIYSANRLLVSAAANGHLAVCRWLHAVDPLTSVDDNDFFAAAGVAAERGHLGVARWLCALRPPDRADDDLFAIRLIHAARDGHADVCRWLLSVVDFSKRTVRSALLEAMQHGRLRVCRYLVAARRTVVGRWRTETLAEALIGGHVGVCRWLLEYYPAAEVCAALTLNGAWRWGFVSWRNRTVTAQTLLAVEAFERSRRTGLDGS